MPETTYELARAIAAGDDAAFARFYERWFDWMYGAARRATGQDEAFCLDVVQDAMMKVIRSIPPLETEASLRAWLSRTVQRCAYDRLRAEVRLKRRERGWRAPVGDERDVLRDRLDWLKAELDRLDNESRRLLEMRHLGWTLQRIGRTLGLSPGAVDGRLSRVLKLLRRKAREQLDE
jgi:RNA polymerase sigma factor (sigma-70 family)